MSLLIGADLVQDLRVVYLKLVKSAKYQIEGEAVKKKCKTSFLSLSHLNNFYLFSLCPCSLEQIC